MAPRITKRILCESVGIWLRPLGNAALRSSAQGNGLVVKASDYSGLGFMGPGIFSMDLSQNAINKEVRIIKYSSTKARNESMSQMQVLAGVSLQAD